MKFVAVSVEEARTISAKRGPRESQWRDLVKEFMAAEMPAAQLDLSELGEARDGGPRKPQSVSSAILAVVRGEKKGEKNFPVSVKLRTKTKDDEGNELPENQHTQVVYLIRDDLTQTEEVEGDTVEEIDEEALAEA